MRKAKQVSANNMHTRRKQTPRQNHDHNNKLEHWNVEYYMIRNIISSNSTQLPKQRHVQVFTQNISMQQKNKATASINRQ